MTTRLTSTLKYSSKHIMCKNMPSSPLKSIIGKKNTHPLPILMVVAVIILALSEQFAPTPWGANFVQVPDIARFNRRFIQVNDYLLNGTDDTTALAYNKVIRHSTIT